MQKRGKSASRRWHPKTRTGCSTCKARKIKCDEQKPQCQNCIRHGVTCAFVTAADSSRQSSVAATSPQNTGDPSLSLNLRDLELLHHYTIYTAHTLTGDSVLNRFWTTEAVQLGYGCEFIMRGFLSLSAMHMASKFPDRAEDLVTTSMVHYNIASRLAMDLIPTAENDDGEKLFVFSVLTVYLVLCNSQNLKDAFAIGDDAAPNWMVLFKGTIHLATSALQSNSNSIILPIVTRSKERYRFLDMEWETPYLDHLNMCLEQWINTNPTPDPAISAIYQRAVRLLRKCFAVFFHIDQQRDLVDVFVWMSMVSGDFMPLLVSKNPPQEALSIFCYFGMLLRKVESQWWLDRWSHNLLIRIYELLDDEHRSWIVLPPGLELYKYSHQGTPDATS